MRTPERNNRNQNADGKKPDQRKKYCRFKKSGIKYIDYKNGDFLLKFLNEQGRILPRRLTGTSLKYQRKLSQAVARARHLAILPFVADALK
jgi:small subunit ribosomal protein S18